MTQELRAAVLAGCAVFFASIPVIAVVSHKGAMTEPMIYPAAKVPNGLFLYNLNGDRVAACDKEVNGADLKLTHCKVETGYTLDDVMNAWLMAYDGK